jgi:hypothetical protein
MKKMMYTLLLGVAAMATITANAQTPTYPYTYSYSTVPYTNLTDSTLILGSDGWDDTIVAFNLPIDFKYQGVPVTQWYMDTYGGLYPNGMDMTGLDLPFILGVYCDYEDKLGATISYKVSGTAGSRIAKVEYRNVGFYDGDAAENANFQIWLYEGSNKIEYHIGPNQVNTATLDYLDNGGVLLTGLLYDINVQDSLMFHTVQLQSGINNDTTMVLDPANFTEDELALQVYGTAYPVNGSVFTFTPTPDQPNSIAKLPSQIGGLHPNPVTDKIMVQLKEQPQAGATISIFTITGKRLSTQPVTTQQTQVDMTTLSKGIYVLTYVADGRRESFRVIKK